MCIGEPVPGRRDRVPTAQGNMENGQERKRQGKHREFGNFAKHRENTGNVVRLSPIFPDSKGCGDFCLDISHFVL